MNYKTSDLLQMQINIKNRSGDWLNDLDELVTLASLALD